MVRELYDGATERVWYITHITALVSTFFSLVGVSYVFFKTYRLSWNRKLDISHKLPAIISLCDFIFNFHHAIDHLYSLSTNRVAAGALCRWLGFGSLVGLQSTALWSMILALYMSLLVVFGVRIDLEKNFWILAAVGWGLPILANTVAAATNQIGDAGMFCMVNGEISAVIMKPTLFLMVFFFITICYIAIAIKLIWHGYYHNRSLSQTRETRPFSQSLRASHRSKLQRVGMHLMGFTVVYILQFFPVCIVVFTTVAGKKPGLALDVLDKILANGNGWMNAIVYRRFLGKSEDSNNTTISTTIRTQDTHDDSVDYYSPNSPHGDVKISVLVSSKTSTS